MSNLKFLKIIPRVRELKDELKTISQTWQGGMSSLKLYLDISESSTSRTLKRAAI